MQNSYQPLITVLHDTSAKINLFFKNYVSKFVKSKLYNAKPFSNAIMVDTKHQLKKYPLYWMHKKKRLNKGSTTPGLSLNNHKVKMDPPIRTVKLSRRKKQ